MEKKLAGLCVAAWSLMAFSAELEGAKWIGEGGETNVVWKRKEAEKALGVTGVKDRMLQIKSPLPKNCLRLRKTFPLAAKTVKSAKVDVSGMGFYELWINGRKADPTRVLAPAMNGRDVGGVCVDTYDVAALLDAGAENAIGLWLSPGYSDDFADSSFGAMWLAPQRAILRLDIAYADGSSGTVVTDGSWQSTRRGPILHASIYNGEIYDAAREDPAWATPRGKSDGWKGVCVFPDGPRFRRTAQPPIRMGDPRRPVAIRETSPGVFTADFGQNRAGFVRLRAKGPKGTRIVIRTSELVKPDGTIDTWTNYRAKPVDTFILAGTGAVEEYVPRFTYHGFRYAEITGWPGKPAADDLEAFAVHTDVKPTASFVCSDPTLNWLHNAATWSMLSNFASFPTDCCMRDERTACRMDSQAYEDAACQFFDMRAYYAKWLDDGGLPTAGNPDWIGDVVTLPHRLWRYYGEEKPFLARYPAAKSYVDAMLKTHPDCIFREGFGDWCAPNSGNWKDYFNDVEIVNTAIFCKILADTAELAARAGAADDAARYRAAAATARANFHREFYRPETATYGDGSQTTAVLPLAFGVVPDGCRAAVAAALLKRIRGKDGKKLDTGVYGTRYIGEVLCDLGEVDLLLELYTQPEYPGYGFLRAQGATTLWEQWAPRGWMHSHNHAMFAGGASWLYTHLAGIRPAKPGYAEILLKPLFPAKLTSLRATRLTPQGEVVVDWRRENGGILLDVTAPAKTPTRLELPDGRVLPVAGRLKLHFRSLTEPSGKSSNAS